MFHRLEYIIKSVPMINKSMIMSVSVRLMFPYSACMTVSEVGDWCASRRLQLNASKTELAWFGSRTNMQKLSALDCCLSVDSSVIKPAAVVRDLGVLLDSELTMKQHVNQELLLSTTSSSPNPPDKTLPCS